MKTSEEIINEIENRITEMRLEIDFAPHNLAEMYIMGDSILYSLLQFIKEEE